MAESKKFEYYYLTEKNLSEEKKKKEKINKEKEDIQRKICLVQVRIYQIISFIALIVLGLLFYTRPYLGLFKYLYFSFITVVYIAFLVFVRGLFVSKIVFMYKNIMMEMYYNGFPPKGDPIVISDNGKIIGTLEGFLFALGVFINSVAFIGIILGIRSYVAVKSHPNKEESEFYIMGMMGSLLASLAMTGIYILVVNAFFDVKVLDQVSKFIPNIL